MRPLATGAILALSILLFCILTGGCQMRTEIPGTNATQPPYLNSPDRIQDENAWQTTIIPPARQQNLSICRIGKCPEDREAGGLYLVSGKEQTGILIADTAPYAFDVINSGGKPLKVFITTWDGNRTMKLYDSSGNVTPLTLVTLDKGKYYVWAINEGPYAFQVR